MDDGDGKRRYTFHLQRFQRRVDRARLGALSGLDTGTSGTYYFDAFESRRSSYIGPMAMGPSLFALSGALAQSKRGLGHFTSYRYSPALQSGSLTFTPTDDAHIFNASPSNNYGSATTLQVDDSPIKHFLLKFDVTGVNSQTVTNAKLCVYNVDGASAGGDFHHVSDDSWQEETVTWNNAPTADTQVLASLGSVSPNTWYEVNLTSHITGDGTYSLRISDSQGGADYSSKEGSNSPKLLVALGGATPQSCSTTATATPTNTPTPGPSPTPTNTSAPTSTPTATQPPQGAFNSATFVYDGDGKRVKSNFNGTTTTYFVGNDYEVTGSTITKYYYAGSQRIAMRTNGTLNFLLGDHLGSTSLTANASGQIVSQLRYKAWGEERYASGPTSTNYTYTGQYSYADDFGLMYYGARWYDTSLGRFNQPDMLIPPTQGIQAWDRYAYSNNNPVKYTDPSGHFIETAWDFAMIGVDLIDIAQNGLNWSNGAALAVDVASAIIPGIPAVGGVLLKTAKAVNAVDNVVDTVNAVDNVVDTANTIDNAIDAGNAADNAADLENMIGATCSFSADTQVTTREGSESISAIEIGDYVLAWNEADGTLGYYEVTATLSHADKVLTHLIINGEWIETTPEHPFYTKEAGWLPADELKPGMHVRQADEDYELVWLKWNIHKTQEMYNLTVDMAHTFFVGEGQWLVHNTCPPGDIKIIEDHLQQFGNDAPNEAMINRLKAGEWTPWDQRFAQHELLESNLMTNGMDYDSAHQMVLRQQGIPYKPGYEALLYHPEVVRNFPDYFSFAAQKMSKLLAKY